MNDNVTDKTKHSKDDQTDTTHFGFEKVATEDKVNKVRGVFESVASRYDVMNDLMSLGVHRLWKHYTLRVSNVRQGQQVLDLAGGTGDLSKGFSKLVGKDGTVILADINNAMLQHGRERLIDQGFVNNITYTQADAEQLPFDDNQFDCISIAFGLRNVTRMDVALKEMHRCLKPGGQLLVLEFSKPTLPGLKPIYDAYSFKLLPKIGKIVANDEESYRYLAESIRMHPDQKTLEKMLVDAGFEQTRYHNLSGGIVALHRGYKL